MTPRDVVTDVDPIEATDRPLQVLESIKRHGVAVLVDRRREPIGVLTYSDMTRLRQHASTAAKAEDLFELDREIYTVPADADPPQMAREIVRRGLKTGIVAVHPRSGRYDGFVFVRDLRGVADDLRERQQHLEGELESIRSQHPVEYERVKRILKKG